LEQAIEQELRKSGSSGEVCPVRCDLRRQSDIEDMFQLIRDKYGRIDICVNIAGLVWKNLLAQGCVEEWKEMLDVSDLIQPWVSKLQMRIEYTEILSHLHFIPMLIIFTSE